MTTMSRRKAKPDYRNILEAALALSPEEQHRLSLVLARGATVQLVPPVSTPAAVRRGQRLGKAVRAELARSIPGSLNAAMRGLRGRLWS